MVLVDDELVDRIAERLAAKLREGLPLHGSTPEPTGPELVDAETLSDRISVSRSTIDRMTRAGRIPSVKIGRRRLFNPTDVVEALNG